MESFGNTKLEGLHEILLPEPIRYTPQTIGWFILFVVGLIVVVWWGYRRYRFWLANRYRGIALKHLEGIERQLHDTTGRIHALTELPVLVKQTALQCYSREKVAELTGDSWLGFLNTSYGGTAFTDGVGKLLPTLAYQSSTALQHIPDAAVNELVKLVKVWIQQHNMK